MKVISLDQELESLKTILHALEPLNEVQRGFVLKTASERLAVSITSIHSPNPAQPQGTPLLSPNLLASSGPQGNPLDRQTPKDFLKAKAPKTEVQRIVCLAYYLTHVRKQSDFKTEDLTKLNTEARGTVLSNPSMAVGNATSQNRFLAPVGQGKKQITGLGEDVVDALPDQEAVKAVLSRQRKPRKRNPRPIESKAR